MPKIPLTVNEADFALFQSVKKQNCGDLQIDQKCNVSASLQTFFWICFISVKDDQHTKLNRNSSNKCKTIGVCIFLGKLSFTF